MADPKKVLQNLSHTKVKDFHACRWFFKRKYIDKALKKEVTEALDAAVQAHKVLENRIKHGKELPAAYAHMEKLIKALEAEYKYLYAEEQFAIDLTSYAPIGYEDWAKGNELGVYRAKIDLIASKQPIEKTREAMVFDWKTGTPREDPAQLRDYAIMMFAHYPKLEKVTARYVWLRERRGGVRIEYLREDLPVLIEKLNKDVSTIRNIRHIVESTDEYRALWFKNPGWKCKWCNDYDCEFNKAR